MIVIKRITRPEEYDNSNLRDTCVFHALRRADETDDVDSLGSHLLEDLRGKDAVGAALREGRTVLAVYHGTIEMPIVLENIRPVDSGNSYAAAARILVKINVGREFDSWVRQQFSNRFRRSFSDAQLIRALIVNGIGNDFRTLFNKEKEEMLLKYGINSTNFPELGDNLRGWCSVVKVLAFQPELSSGARSGFFCGMASEVARILKPTISEVVMDIIGNWQDRFFRELKARPMKMLAIMAGIVIVMLVLRGCINANARREREREREAEIADVNHKSRLPVAGVVEVVCSQGGDAVAADMLRRDAVNCIAQEFGRFNVTWDSGREVKLLRKDWAQVFAELRKFAAESDGEFSFELAENKNRASVIAHTQKVLSFVFDASALNGEPMLMAEITSAFGISFSGKAVSDPKPVRRKTMLAGMEKIKNGHKVTVTRNGTTLTFLPDYKWLVRDVSHLKDLTADEIIRKANEFWAGEAEEGFARYPRESAEFAEKFRALDHDYTEGFDAAVKDLAALSMSLEQEAGNARIFLGKCDREWLRFTAPSDRPSKMLLVGEAAKAMDRLKISVDERLQDVKKRAEVAALKDGFDAEVAKFKASSEAWWNGVAELITAYNNQVARKGNVSKLVGEIVSARERMDFSEMAAFSKRIDDAKAARLAVAKDEAVVAQRIAPSLAFSYVDSILGASWAKRVKKGYSALTGASAEVDVMTGEFSDKAVNYFCPVGTRRRTLDKALENALAYADAVAYNHDAKSVQPKGSQSSGTEVDLISQAETALTSLIRAQRRAAQGANRR